MRKQRLYLAVVFGVAMLVFLFLYAQRRPLAPVPMRAWPAAAGPTLGLPPGPAPTLGAAGTLAEGVAPSLDAAPGAPLTDKQMAAVQEAMAKLTPPPSQAGPGEAPRAPTPRELMQQDREAIVAEAYDDLFKQLNLTDREQLRLRQVLSLKPLFRGGPGGGGAAPAATGQPEAATEDLDSVEGTVRSILGAERYEVYRDYRATLPSRLFIKQYEQTLAAVGSSLGADRQAGLIQIVAEEAPAVAIPAPIASAADIGRLGAEMDINIEKRAASNLRIATRASAILDGPQLQALQALQESNLQKDRAAAGAYRQLAQPPPLPPRQ